ncbi:hypothetical protein RCL1_007052 [Eukaryota sp. TZLM3-RCL]
MQIGFHALFGLFLIYLSKFFLALDFVCQVAPFLYLGSILPDFDLYLDVLSIIITRSIKVRFHRTLTHSLVVHLIFVAISSCVFVSVPALGIKMFAFVFAASLHVVFDIFFWFTEIEIFWPFSKQLGKVSLFGKFKVPLKLQAILGALEHLSVALFLIALSALNPVFTTDYPFIFYNICLLEFLYSIFVFALHFLVSPSLVLVFLFAPLFLISFPVLLLPILLDGLF